MPQELISQYNRNFALPIETFRQVQTVTNRDAIPTNRRWEGMIVYVVTDSLSYVLVGGTANSQWVELGTLVDVNVVDNLLSTSPTDALSANQGRVLKDLIDAINPDISWGDITGTLSDQTDLQSALNAKQSLSEKNTANGYAPLDSGAKVPLANLPDSILGQVSYQGTWNASTNTPTLSDPTTSATKGYYYVTSVGGTQFGIAFAVGDWVISNGANWQKVDNTDAVISVFGRIGPVVANAGDYAAFYLGINSKAVDSNLLDGLDSTQFLRSDVSDSTTGGTLTIGGLMNIKNNGAFPYVSFDGSQGTVRNLLNSGVELRWYYDGVNFGKIWHSENDGTGSGLDADLLDGIQGGSYLRSDATDVKTAGNLMFANNVRIIGIESGGTEKNLLFMSTLNNVELGSSANVTNISGSTVNVLSSSSSTSKDTGALILTAGGLGVEQAIFSGGNMNAPNFVLTSDRRKKKNIKPIELDRLLIAWKEFELNDFPGEIRYGAIAQEVQKVAPELVSVNGKGELSLKYIDLLVRKVAELENYIYGSSRHDNV